MRILRRRNRNPIYSIESRVSLPHDLMFLLNAMAFHRGISRALLLEEIIREYLNKDGYTSMLRKIEEDDSRSSLTNKG